MRFWCVALSLGCAVIAPTELAAQYVLDGIVYDSVTGAPLSDVIVSMKNSAMTTQTPATGHFRMTGLPANPSDVLLRRIGYQPRVLVGLTLPLAGPLTLTLAPSNVPALEDLVVETPRTNDIMGRLDHVIDAEEGVKRSSLGEDAYRGLTRVPGVAADELSARFRMRGAEQEEVLVRLDGLTLLDPFHLKEIGAAFSVVDGRWVAQTTVSAAGFGAQYGDRTAGAVEFATFEPSTSDKHLLLSANPTHVRVATEGKWPGGGWLVSARRGVPQLVLAAVGQSAAYSPAYMDGMMKVTFTPAANHLLSAHLLLGADRFTALMDQGQIVSQSQSQRTYGWVRWRAGWSNALHAETVGSLTDILPSRDVAFFPHYPDGVSDHRSLRQLGLRHDLDLSTGHIFGLRAGAEVVHGESRYEYAFRAPLEIMSSPTATVGHADTGTALLAQKGTALAVYVSPHVWLWQRFNLETGLRYDRASYAGTSRLSPRFRGRLELAERLTVFGSWGLYSQAKGLSELDVVVGERTWAVQQATQMTAGIEWRPAGATRMRAEAYHRNITKPWARHLNVELGFEIVPEVDNDNIYVAPTRSRADGIDLEIDGRLGYAVRWRAGYSLSRVDDMLGGRWIPRTYDQRHAASLDATWKPGERWSVAGAWQWHSGWPIAEPDFVHYTVQGGRVVPRYDYMAMGESGLPAYQRLDVRVRHELRLAGGTLGLTVDLVNILNRKNVGGLSYDGIRNADGSVTVHRNPMPMAPLVPIVGVSWVY